MRNVPPDPSSSCLIDDAVRGVGSDSDWSPVGTDGEDVGGSAQGGHCYPPANQCWGCKYIENLDPGPEFWPNLDLDPGL